jgi:hypothetical protein
MLRSTPAILSEGLLLICGIISTATSIDEGKHILQRPAAQGILCKGCGPTPLWRNPEPANTIWSEDALKGISGQNKGGASAPVTLGDVHAKRSAAGRSIGAGF